MSDFESVRRRPSRLRDRLNGRVEWLIGPTVRILMVADGSIEFRPDSSFAGFTLYEAVQVLEDRQRPDYPNYVRFEVTTAHRSAASPRPGSRGEDIAEFRFTAGSLDDFDEVWLFGIVTRDQSQQAINGSYLSESEVAVIARFMDERKGGVLAMGDHEDLGQGLCAAIPRVRSMRRWWEHSRGGAIPAGEPDTPNRVDLSRNDTVTSPSGVLDGAGTETDSTPQKIEIEWYSRTHYVSPFFFGTATYPHPVLCGPRGPIEYFPDHPHEGDCYVPTDLNDSFTFDGFQIEEYPGGVAPELIARGVNVVNRTKQGFTISDPRPFGLLTVYDGHDERANVGRVICDSTWHHWFDMNLDGIKAAGEDANATQQDETVWRDIQVFFRNCAIWLAPPSKQSRMSIALNLQVRIRPELIELIERDRLTVIELFDIGTVARDALGRLAPVCQSERWQIERLRPLIPDLISRIDPWHRIPPRPRPGPRPGPWPGPDPAPWLAPVPNVEELTTLALGVQIMALAQLDSDALAKLDLDDERMVERLEKILQDAAAGALELGLKRMQTYASGLAKRAETVAASMRVRSRRLPFEIRDDAHDFDI